MDNKLQDLHIHPIVWNLVRRMYEYCFDSEKKIRSAFKTLGLEANIDQMQEDGLDDFLIGLIPTDTFKVLKDVLEIPDFWPDRNDLAIERNYANKLMERLRIGISILPEPNKPLIAEQKLWGSQLVSLLEQKNGISYDKSANEFKYVGVSGVIVIPSTIPRPQFLIKGISNDKVSNDPFYRKLVGEINIAYTSGLNTSSILLSRKLFENLIIDILKNKYPADIHENLDLYYNKNERRHRDFSSLIDVLNQNKNDFAPEERTVSQLISKIEPFREHANLAAHTLTLIPDAQELLRYDIQYVLDLLLRLIK